MRLTPFSALISSKILEGCCHTSKNYTTWQHKNEATYYVRILCFLGCIFIMASFKGVLDWWFGVMIPIKKSKVSHIVSMSIWLSNDYKTSFRSSALQTYSIHHFLMNFKVCNKWFTILTSINLMTMFQVGSHAFKKCECLA